MAKENQKTTTLVMSALIIVALVVTMTLSIFDKKMTYRVIYEDMVKETVREMIMSGEL
jgi:cytochrome c-type biogenesis protein CcmE